MAFLEESAWRGKVYSCGWKAAAGGDAPVTEPATGAELGRTGIGSPADVAEATAAAAAAQTAWAATPHTEQAAVLRRAGDIWKAHAGEIEQWSIREGGKVPPAAQFDDVMRGLDLARRIPTGIVHINEQTVDDEPNIPFGGVLSSGTGARFGGASNLEAFTDTRWVTMRGDITPYPF